MLRISKNDYAVENCATLEFNNALDNFITRVWRKSNSRNLKDIVEYVYDNVNKICIEDVENVTYCDLKRITRLFVNELDLDRSESTELMVIDEIFNISHFYYRCNTEHDDF